MKRIFPISSLLLFLISCAAPQMVLVENSMDSDLDGVHDSRDACPNLAGSIFNLGCPRDQSQQLSSIYNKEKSTDADLDGVPDDKDDCPLIYGSPFNMGCPFGMER